MVPFPARDEMYFSSPKRPDRFWDQSSLLPSGYSGLIPWGQDGWGVELTTHVHLMPTLRISGAIPHYSTFSGRAQGARPFQFIIHESPCIRRYIYIYIYIYISRNNCVRFLFVGLDERRSKRDELLVRILDAATRVKKRADKLNARQSHMSCKVH